MNSGRVIIWPNAIETERFAYNEAVRQEMRSSLGLEEKFVVDHAGGFRNQKNHDFLIDIFAEIRKRRDDAVLLLVGGGQLMNEIKAKVMKLGLNDCVIFAGYKGDIERYYQVMDVFVFPSLYEGLGMVAVEAQVSGLPTVCSTEVPDEAKICDACKFIPLSRSASEWADETFKLCYGHIRRDMSQYARSAGFDIKQQAQKLTAWYCELLGL